MFWLSLLFGAVVGLSLGLTGGGGAIFAVPMLVYGLQMSAVEAVGVSLAAVGVTAAVGFVRRWRQGQVETPTGLLFAGAGMLGAPAGSWISRQLPEPLLLTQFAGLMILIAARMAWQSMRLPQGPHEFEPPAPGEGPACQRDAGGALHLNTRCAMVLIVVGIFAGLLSGMFGVGGGFIIVPALMLFSGMSIQRAVGTSLLVITLVSLSGVASYLMAGQSIPPLVTGLFIAGGVAGLFAGQALGNQIPSHVLQRIFAVAIVVVGLFVMVQTLVG